MKTLLVDNHALFREGLALLITQSLPELELLQAGDIAEALAQLERHPELHRVLLDLALPDGVMQTALRRVLSGGVYLPPELPDPRTAAGEAGPEAATAIGGDRAGLTPRQCDVLRLLIEGKTNKLICRELELSESTVKTHLASIFRRLGATSRTQAVVAAGRMGLRLGPAAAGT